MTLKELEKTLNGIKKGLYNADDYDTIIYYRSLLHELFNEIKNDDKLYNFYVNFTKKL